MTIDRGRHGGKHSNNRIQLKRWMVIEMRWKRKADSLSSPETEEMRRPRVLMNSWTIHGTKILYCDWLKAVVRERIPVFYYYCYYFYTLGIKDIITQENNEWRIFKV